MEKTQLVQDTSHLTYGTEPCVEEAGNGDGETVHEPKTCCQRTYPRGFFWELRQLWTLIWPMVLTQITQYLFFSVAVMFCGHLGKYELDAVALANSLINVTGISIAQGLAAACDTYFAQIFGSDNKKRLGVVLQRSLVIMFLAAFPCAALQLNAENILLLLGQDAKVANLTAQYILTFMPGHFSYFLYTSLVRYIQCQGIVIPNMVVGVIANIINAVLHYVLIYVYNYGIIGSAIAMAASYFTMLILTLIYIIVFKVYRDTWQGWSWECLDDWGGFTKLAIFGVLMMCIEWWSFEVGIIASGTLGTTELGVQSVIFQLTSLAFTVPLGTSIAVSVRVGQSLGAEDIDSAKTTVRVGLTFTAITGASLGILFASLMDYLPLIFTNDPEVVEMASEVMPILAAYTIFDSTVGVANGILRGFGKQQLGAGICAVNYTLSLTLALALLLATPLSVKGYWIGMTLALVFLSFIYHGVIHCSNWEKLVQAAKERTHKESEGENDMFVDERTGLLQNSQAVGLTDSPTDSMRIKNHSYQTENVEQITSAKPTYAISCGVLLLRSFSVLLMVGLFLIGIIVRVAVPPPTQNDVLQNYTAIPFNITSAELM